jgi:hypothetical protein
MVLREAQVPVLLVRAPEPGAVKRSVAATKPAARAPRRAPTSRKGTPVARAALV